MLEPEYSLAQLLFEEVSAFGTVGLSTGITPGLCEGSKLLLIFTMFAGRVGTFTLLSIWIDRPAPSVHYTEVLLQLGNAERKAHMKKRKDSATFGIIGLGRFGLALTECLSKAGKEVIAIDKDESQVREARRFTEMALVVESMNQEALEETGIQNCDTVVVCIGERIDASILITMTVLNMGVPHVISKATSFMHGEALKRLGATVVFPERDMAVRVGKGLIYHSFLDSVTLEGNVEVRRYRSQRNWLASVSVRRMSGKGMG